MVSAVVAFETAAVPPPDGSTESLPDWVSIRDAGLAARHCSALSDSEKGRSEFVAGAKALGLVGRAKTLKAQQLLLADTLNAGAKFNSVLMPRRSTKTTSLLAWLIGRCLNRPDYLCAYAVMTSQKKARDRFLKDVVPILERVYPDESTRPFVIRTQNGGERLMFNNGSILQFLGPNPNDFISDAYDVIVLDESGEPEPEVGGEVLSGALPTMDTRPGAMIVFAGTAAKYRKGNLLWDELEKGRAGEERHGIVDFSTDVDSIADDVTWEDVEPLVLASHPGIASDLTTLADVRDNFYILGPEKFARQYLGIFGQTGSSSFLNVVKWAEQQSADPLPEPPARFAMAFQVHPESTSCSIVAAWRDDTGRAFWLELYYGRVQGLNAEQLRLSHKYRMPVAYDSGNAATDTEGRKLARARPRPNLLPQTWPDVSAAAAVALKEIEAGNVGHWGQEHLNAAVAGAGKRGVRDSKRWAFKHIDQGDIVSLEAGSIALHAYDKNPIRSSTKVPKAMQ